MGETLPIKYFNLMAFVKKDEDEDNIKIPFCLFIFSPTSIVVENFSGNIFYELYRIGAHVENER